MSKITATSTPDEILANIVKRLEALEGGGKKLVKVTNVSAVSGITIANGGITTVRTTVAWQDAAITDNPKPDLYWDLYINNDNNGAYRWPGGASLTSTQIREIYVHQRRVSSGLGGDNSKGYWDTTIHNNTGSSITVYMYTAAVYLSGQSGSTT